MIRNIIAQSLNIQILTGNICQKDQNSIASHRTNTFNVVVVIAFLIVLVDIFDVVDSVFGFFVPFVGLVGFVALVVFLVLFVVTGLSVVVAFFVLDCVCVWIDSVVDGILVVVVVVVVVVEVVVSTFAVVDSGNFCVVVLPEVLELTMGLAVVYLR